jgi:hypothetical protein
MNPLRRDHYRCTSLSADGLVKSGKGYLGGFLVSASTAGVIRLYDNTAASGTVILDQFTVAAGDNVTFRVEFQTGLYFDLVSGTATVSILHI